MDMDEKAQAIMKAQLATLPPEVRTILGGVDLPTKLKLIAQNHHLRVDESAVLENETTLVLIGLEHPNAFLPNLQRELHVPAEMAQAIAMDVNNRVFAPVHDALITLHQKEAVEAELPLSEVPAAMVSETPEAPPLAPEVVQPVQPSGGTAIAAARLSGAFHLPSDTVAVSPASVASSPIPRPSSPVSGGTYMKDADPYREPIV